jgi:hypothetical protein
VKKTERKDGGLSRWGVNRPYWVRVGDEPFLDRKVLVICPWFGVFLTEIYKPDAGRAPHDHSRTFASLILSGGYTELVYSDPACARLRVRHHERWSFHVMPRSKAHTITEVHGRLRTLVFAGKSRGTWAFWTAQGKVDWKTYGLESAAWDAGLRRSAMASAGTARGRLPPGTRSG